MNTMHRRDRAGPVRRYFSQTTQALSLQIAFFAILAVILSACGRIAPATPPAQLDHTPGPPITIADGTYTSVAFTVDYPAGWTVISSPAFSEPWTAFTSPDDNAVIVVAVDPDDTDVSPASAQGEITRTVETVTLADDTITIVLVTGDSDTFQPIFAAVVASVR